MCVSLILFMMPTVLLFIESALSIDPRAGKAWAKRLEEDARSHRKCRRVCSLPAGRAALARPLSRPMRQLQQQPQHKAAPEQPRWSSSRPPHWGSHRPTAHSPRPSKPLEVHAQRRGRAQPLPSHAKPLLEGRGRERGRACGQTAWLASSG